jgi:hypothetical protein
MTSLTITKEAVVRLAAEVGRFGTDEAETGAFLLVGASGEDRLNVVALAGHAGIDRRRDRFGVSGEAVERLFVWAGDRGLRIRAQVHSHRHKAFLSRTDLDYGFAVEGFISSVVPQYGDPPAEPSDWGWWIYERGAWRGAPPPRVIDDSTGFVSFDARGVHAA